jgi:carbon-monoxide dehydrogenase medium subunit
MSGFELAHPSSLREAIGLMDGEDPTVRPFSGGTALMLMMKAGVFQPSRLVSLRAIEAKHAQISATAQGGLSIGAMATLTAIEHSPEIRRFAPVIGRAMVRLANVRVRNVARLGGSLAHGDPHMDLPPVLAALGGETILTGPAGDRRVAVQDLFVGYYETVLQPGELIAGVALPTQAGWSSVYLKTTTRSADDWPALGVAVSVRVTQGRIGDARLFVSAATERLTRLVGAEAALRGLQAGPAAFGRAAEAAAAEAETISDSRGSAAYKTQLLRVQLRRGLEQATQEGLPQ